MNTPEEYKDIAPYDDHEFKEQMAKLVVEPGFKHAVTYVMPMIDYDAFVKQLLSIDSKESFHRNIMVPFLEMLANKTTSGITIDGLEHISPTSNFTFISNHRDIVLDATFLYLCLLRNNIKAGETALGDNLLIFEWIERLVKLNKGLIVKRGLSRIKGFEAAVHLSNYIRWCITEKHESVWIAQREGRAKDSNDMTQESVLKMLALSNSSSVEDIIATLSDLNICPTTISYEYDPNDYLKATEFLRRQRDPEYVKSEHDDLLSMETGLLGFKGKVHYHLSGTLNEDLATMHSIADKKDLFPAVCAALDKKIHLGYKLFTTNYIAYDTLYDSNRFADKYTAEEASRFDAYLDDQLKKVRLTDVSADEHAYMKRMMLTMYANPLINKYKAQGEDLATND